MAKTISPWVDVNCGQTGYNREQWCRRWQLMMKHFFNADISYDYNGRIVSWIIEDQKLRETMTTIWSLKEKGYRCSYQPHIRTFFWVDSDFYRQNKHEILQWAERYNCKVPSREHGWIEMPNERVELLFRLTWAGEVYG
jgi:hypothetical protein